MLKKATLETKTIIELILAAAGIFLLLYLFFQMFSPGFDKGYEISKSYFDTLKKQIAIADAGNVGELSLYQNQIEELVYLTYFGSSSVKRIDVKDTLWGIIPWGYSSISIIASESYENQICICYLKDRNRFVCKKDTCASLKYPAIFIKKDGTELPPNELLPQNPDFLITLKDNKYIFTIK